MCDYSLENVQSRPAAIGNTLVVTAFANTITRGFAAVDDIYCAVCLRPGTELSFEREVEYDHPVTHCRTRSGATTARFREIDRDLAYADHDALEFPDGTLVPLTRLVCGQRATVLQLPVRLEQARAPVAATAPAGKVVV